MKKNIKISILIIELIMIIMLSYSLYQYKHNFTVSYDIAGDCDQITDNEIIDKVSNTMSKNYPEYDYHLKKILKSQFTLRMEDRCFVEAYIDKKIKNG